jgi:hypothetical protein
MIREKYFGGDGIDLEGDEEKNGCFGFGLLGAMEI